MSERKTPSDNLPSPEPPALTPAQWNVMRAVWRTEPTTVRRVLDALADEDKRDYRTIQTFLYQLEEKGYVTFHIEGKTALFESTVDKTTGFRVHLRRYFGSKKDREDLELLQAVTEDELQGKVRPAPSPTVATRTGSARKSSKRRRRPRSPSKTAATAGDSAPNPPSSGSSGSSSSPLFPWED